MKILFVKPPKNEISIYGDSNIEPLEFEILAAPLNKQHDVLILDMRLDNDLAGSLKSFQPEVVGFTGYTIDVNSILGLAEKIKRHNPEIKVVVGGHHASLLPHDFYHPAVDVVVIGDGEITFNELISSFEQGEKIDHIPGLAVNEHDGQRFTLRLPIPKDLCKLPVPDRSLTRKYRTRYFSGTYRPMAAMITSRGCPYKCTFCSIWKFMGGVYLVRGVKQVADELELIKEPYVFFVDDNLTTHAKHFEELYEEIKRRGIQKKYKAYGRTDAIVKRPDLIEKWSRIGLKQITLGMEGIKDSDLKLLNKHNTTDNNLQAIHILKQNGIDVKPYFIVTQDFTKDDFEELYQFVEKKELESPSFSILTPLPGTTLYEELYDKICITDYEFFDLAHSVLPTKLPRKEFYYQFIRLYSRCYSPGKSAIRSLKNTINHISGKPAKRLPTIPLKKVLFYNVIAPTVSRWRYKQELQIKSD